MTELFEKYTLTGLLVLAIALIIAFVFDVLRFEEKKNQELRKKFDRYPKAKKKEIDRLLDFDKSDIYR